MQERLTTLQLQKRDKLLTTKRGCWNMHPFKKFKKMGNTERKNRIERIRKTTDGWGYSHLNFDKMHDLNIVILDNYVANISMHISCILSKFRWL